MASEEEGKLQGRSIALQMAIVFSRKLYNLDNLDAYLRAPDESLDRDAEKIAATVDDMLSNNDDENNTLVWNSAKLGFEVMFQMQRADTIPGDDPRVMAIQTIFSGTRVSDDDNSFDNMQYPEYLTWSDCEFQMSYQTLCRRVWRLLRHKYIGAINPSELYHGPTFHGVASFYRAEADAEKRKAEKKGKSPVRRDLTAPVKLSQKYRAETSKSTPTKGNSNDKGEVKKTSKSSPTPLTIEPKQVLPIEEHADKITKHITENRITIIVGETGCGKSSKVPTMILERNSKAKIIVSQPHRIAARALRDRLATSVGDAVGLRLGHGIREETPKTRIWFCTAGYLKVFMANNDAAMSKFTHLIIDEVHERSIETDLTCFFAKKAMHDFPHLKLVLMSATASTQKYREYFDVKEEPIFVGARRFPLKENFLDDMAMDESLPGPVRTKSKMLLGCRVTEDSIPKKYIENQYQLAFHLARRVGQPGRCVLIFVSGMAGIEEISSLFDDIADAAGRKSYKVIAVHSDIPFEQQMESFETDTEHVKIVIATNAAESSITLPGCDNVICLGTQKAIKYDQSSHRMMLVQKWIAKDSATQRAGRTARTAPGTVWRLYPQMIYGVMAPHQPPEILNSPLDNVVLELKTSFPMPASEILAGVMDPPKAEHIDASLQSLFEMNFLTSPIDEVANPTDEGVVASRLGTDLSLACMVIYGLRLGIPREAVCLAVSVSQQYTPFVRISHFVQEPSDMYEKLSRIIKGQEYFDAGLQSAPLMIYRVVNWYRSTKADQARCYKHGLVASRVRTLNKSVEYMERQLGSCSEIQFDPQYNANIGKPCPDILEDRTLLNKLRLILFWAFHKQTVTVRTKRPPVHPNTITLNISTGPVKKEQLEAILPKDVNYTLMDHGTQEYLILETSKDAAELSLASRMDTYLLGDVFKDDPLRWLITQEIGWLYVSDVVKSDVTTMSIVQSILSKDYFEDEEDSIVTNGATIYQFSKDVLSVKAKRQKLRKSLRDLIRGSMKCTYAHITENQCHLFTETTTVSCESLQDVFCEPQFVVSLVKRDTTQGIDFAFDADTEESEIDKKLLHECARPIKTNIPLGARLLDHYMRCGKRSNKGSARYKRLITLPATEKEPVREIPGMPSKKDAKEENVDDNQMEISIPYSVIWSMDGEQTLSNVTHVMVNSSSLAATSTECHPDYISTERVGVAVSCMLIMSKKQQNGDSDEEYVSNDAKQNCSVVLDHLSLAPNLQWFSAAMACIGLGSKYQLERKAANLCAQIRCTLDSPDLRKNEELCALVTQLYYLVTDDVQPDISTKPPNKPKTSQKKKERVTENKASGIQFELKSKEQMISKKKTEPKSKSIEVNPVKSPQKNESRKPEALRELSKNKKKEPEKADKSSKGREAKENRPKDKSKKNIIGAGVNSKQSMQSRGNNSNKLEEAKEEQEEQASPQSTSQSKKAKKKKLEKAKAQEEVIQLQDLESKLKSMLQLGQTNTSLETPNAANSKKISKKEKNQNNVPQESRDILAPSVLPAPNAKKLLKKGKNQNKAVQEQNKRVQESPNVTIVAPTKQNKKKDKKEACDKCEKLEKKVGELQAQLAAANAEIALLKTNTMFQPYTPQFSASNLNF
eukprot:m.337128 g.337128  ORF g.337128 m.337128 type:complete len:1619 (+) comp18055_c0_seq1:136-4992(+)